LGTHSLHLSILGLLSLLVGFAGKDSLSVLVELEADNLALGSIDTDGNGSTRGLVTVDTLDLLTSLNVSCVSFGDIVARK
jgi:hypothetical protein